MKEEKPNFSTPFIIASMLIVFAFFAMRTGHRVLMWFELVLAGLVCITGLLDNNFLVVRQDKDSDDDWPPKGTA